MNAILSKKFIIILTIILVIVILISFMVSRKPSTPNGTDPTSTSTSSTLISTTPSGSSNITITSSVFVEPTILITLDPNSPQEGVEYYAIDPSEEKKYIQVGKLMEVVPFTGVNLSLRYDFDLNKYIATIPSDKKNEGEKELDTFLSRQGIQSRDWIHNLTIEYK